MKSHQLVYLKQMYILHVYTFVISPCLGIELGPVLLFIQHCTFIITLIFLLSVSSNVSGVTCTVYNIDAFMYCFYKLTFLILPSLVKYPSREDICENKDKVCSHSQ